MIVDRKLFYDRYRPRFGRLSVAQVSGYEAFFDFWDSRSVLTDKRWLAYILATAFHETGKRLQAVREGFCDTDACSVRAVTTLFNQRRISRNYALPHENGNSYFGRGFVQLTHGFNYKSSGQNIGLGNRVYDDPDLALDTATSVKITCVGMLIGSFTGHKLEQHFTDTKSDWKDARKIVNGRDKATLIAGHGKKFLECIEYKRSPAPVPATTPDAEPPGGSIDPTDAAAILAEIERLKQRVAELGGFELETASRLPEGAESVYLPEDSVAPASDSSAWSGALMDDDAEASVISFEEHLAIPDDPEDADD